MTQVLKFNPNLNSILLVVPLSLLRIFIVVTCDTNVVLHDTSEASTANLEEVIVSKSTNPIDFMNSTCDTIELVKCMK